MQTRTPVWFLNKAALDQTVVLSQCVFYGKRSYTGEDLSAVTQTA